MQYFVESGTVFLKDFMSSVSQYGRERFEEVLGGSGRPSLMQSISHLPTCGVVFEISRSSSTSVYDYNCF
jgi:hypothetical protein